MLRSIRVRTMGIVLLWSAIAGSEAPTRPASAASSPSWTCTQLAIGYGQGRSVPCGYHIELRSRPDLRNAGYGLFVPAYLVSFAVGASASAGEPGDRWLMAPVVGPIGAAVARGDEQHTKSADSIPGMLARVLLFTIDAGLQGTGVVLWCAGIWSREVLVPDNDARTGPVRVSWALAPSVGRAGGAVMLTGTW